MINNCEFDEDILTKEDKEGKLTFGKRMLTSHRHYNLWNEENNTFNTQEINNMYSKFIDNMKLAATIFETRWVNADELITTSKGLIWDWTDNEEKMKTANDILENGMYFPIFTLDRGKIHNQIISKEEAEELKAKNLYNSYNGNHRIDIIHYWQELGKWDKKILIYIIPEFCQKSCTGFKYTPIDDHDKDNSLVQQKFSNPINMYHLDYLEHEMKVTNWRTKKEIETGVSLVSVDNYNVAFRILMEFQNVLEQPLVNYYKTYGKLPLSIKKMSHKYNDEYEYNNFMER